MKKIVRLIICVCAFMLVTSISAYAADNFDRGAVLPLNTNYSCNVNAPDDVKFFKFTPSITGYYTYSSSGYYDTVGAVFDDEKECILSDDDSGDNSNFSVKVLLVEGYQYYFTAYLYSDDDTGRFDVKLSGPSSDKLYIDSNNTEVEISPSVCSYTGNPIKPEVAVYYDGIYELTPGVDYTVNYYDNIEKGQGTVYISGNNHVSGTITKTFNIIDKSKNIEEAKVSLPSNAYNYTGNEICPKPVVKIDTITLRENIDYYVEYGNNINPGTAYYWIEGMNDYQGSNYGTFKINKLTIKPANVALSTGSIQYNFGYARGVGVTVKVGSRTLKNGTDYTLKYLNNRNVGTATVVVTGKGAYSGTVKKNFRITPKKMTNAYIYDQTYNGKTKTPSVYIDVLRYDSDYGEYYYSESGAKKGRDYTIKISGGHKKIGTYTATIKFKGNYTGTVKKKFKILPKMVKGIKTKKISGSEIKVSWKKVKGAEGYMIYCYDSKKGKERLIKKTKGTSVKLKRVRKDDDYISFSVIAYKKVGKKTYKSDYNGGYAYLTPSAPSISVSRSNFGEFYVYFSKTGNYQVQISTSKKFSRNSGAYLGEWRYTNTGSVRFYNFASGTKYYIRARKYYYDSNGRLKVGPWCKTKTVVPY